MLFVHYYICALFNSAVLEMKSFPKNQFAKLHVKMSRSAPRHYFELAYVNLGISLALVNQNTTNQQNARDFILVKRNITRLAGEVRLQPNVFFMLG